MHFRNLAKIATAALLSIALIPSTAVASDTAVPSNFTNDSMSITGSIDLSKYAHNTGNEVERNNKKYYEGTIEGSVEASDLFEGAYQKYNSELKNKYFTFLWKKYYIRNIVMSDFGEKFPTMHLKVKFPANFTVKKDNIEVTANTSTISEVSHVYDSTNNTVDITYKLGNWNDYEGFFKLVEAERGQSGHLITLKIPYTVELSTTTGNLGTIKAHGSCKLYKYGKIYREKQIVNVTTDLDFEIVRGSVNK